MASSSRRRLAGGHTEGDETLTARLRALGYSLALPTPLAPSEQTETDSGHDATSTPSKAQGQKTALQLMVDQVEAEIARMRRAKHPVTPEVLPVQAGARTPSPAAQSADEADLSTLAFLLRLADDHRHAATEAKEKKQRDKKRAKAAAPVTPTQGNAKRLEDLSLSSTPRAGPSQPPSLQKRRRRPSTPSTPCPPTYPTTPQRSSRRSPSASEVSSIDSPSPSKRAYSRLHHIVSLVGLSLRVVGAADPADFAATSARLAELIPGVTILQLVDLAQAVRSNPAILSISHEHAQARGRTFEASLSFFSKQLFASSSTNLPPDPPHAALYLARALEQYPPPLLASPTNAPRPPRILSTRHTSCVQCASPLTLRQHPTDPVYLVEPASPASPVLIARHTCTNPACRAIHAPDHVEITHDDTSVWLWEADAEAYKVGERTWVSRAFARHYRATLLEQATSPGAFAALWNRLYGSSDGLEDDEDAEEEGSSSTEKVSPKKGRAGARPFVLHSRQVWRSFVINSCIQAASQLRSGRFASYARASTDDLVALANADLFDSATSEGGAHVMGSHSCEVCTHERKRWIGGHATRAEREQGVRWAGTHAKEGQKLVEDTEPVDGPPVQLAVCDGIEIGHPLCASPGCLNPPERHRRSGRFCDEHHDLHAECGIFGCGRPVDDRLDALNGASEACDLPAHRALWEGFARKRADVVDRGWTGRRRGGGRSSKYPVEGADPVKREVKLELGSDEETETGLSDSEEDEETETGLSDSEEDEEEETKPRLGRPKATHMWNMRRTSNLQLLVAACGTPLAWTKFSDGETAAQVVSFLATAHAAAISEDSTTTAFPSYIAYDRACHVLRHVLSSLRPSSTTSPVKPPSLPSFLQSTRLIVTAFHKRCHARDDSFCDEFCNPTPLDGEAPDLVVPFRPAGQRRSKKRGQEDEIRTFERAYNTSAAEQLNSTLSRFAPLLSTFRADYFDFLVHVLLRYRRDEVERKRKKT